MIVAVQTNRYRGKWDLRVLDGFRLEGEGGREVPFYERKQDVLLAYLAVSREGSILRRSIAKALWPEHASADARNRLTEVLFRLRRELTDGGFPPDEVLTADRHSLGLSDAVQTDLADLERLLDQATDPATDAAAARTIAREAQDLYGQGLLPFLNETWIVARRAELESRLTAIGVPIGVPQGPATEPASPADAGTAFQIITESIKEKGLAHLSRCVELAELAEPNLFTPERGEWVSRIEGMDADLEQALVWAERYRETHLAARLAGALWPYWYASGRVGAGRQRLEELLTKRPNGDTAADAKVLNGAGTLAYAEGDLDIARGYLKQSIGLWTTTNDDVGLARAIANLGMVEYREGNLEEARMQYAKALDILERVVPDSPHIPQFVRNGALVEREARNLPKAREMLLSLVDRIQQAGDEVLGGMVWADLTIVAQLEEDWPAALDYGAKAREVLEKHGDKRGMATALRSLAYTCQEMGDSESARRFYKEALALAQSMSDAWAIGETLGAMAGLAVDVGDKDAARRLFRQARALLQSVHDKAGVAQVEDELAKLAKTPADAESAPQP